VSVRIVITLIIVLLSTAAATQGEPKTDGAVDFKLIEEYQKQLENEGDPAFLINAITNNNIKDLSLNRELLLEHNDIVNHSLKSAGITNQKSSGRCWMFAGFNVLTPDLAAKMKLSKIELSQSWLAFWDKMEKSNLFLEEIIRLRDRPINDRELQVILESPIGDGGWWHYFTGLVDKYGVVPKSAMPETKQSSSTGMLNKLTTSKLRRFASELRQMHVEGKSEKDLRQRKEAMLADVYTILVYTYGEPPSEFSLRYKPDKKDEEKDDDETDSGSAAVDSVEAEKEPEIIEARYTPATFYEEFFDGELPEYVALCNNPTREYGQLYQILTSRNMYEAEDFTVLNLPIERLKHYSARALLDSQVVWFACDVGKQNYGDSGIFREGIYDYNRTFGMDFRLSKADRISFKDISPNHAMVLMGVDTAADGTPVKWLVENSWGSKKGDEGNWYMYDDWFDEYVLVTIIDRRLMEEPEVEMLEQKPLPIEAWDPFFLALRRLE
jgi:bleomycin hydrolase